MKSYHWCLFFCLCFLTSCGDKPVYSHFYPISYQDGTINSSEKWHIDSVAQFDYAIADTSVDYKILLYVRHTERYPYQNMWLFVSDSLHADTIEFYLADDRGQWLGNKHHGFMEMPVLYEESVHFSQVGMYHMNIRHAMRDTLLRGITEVGLEIVTVP